MDLSLEEKIGQMIIYGINDVNVTERLKFMIKQYKIGGVILYKKNYKTYDELINLVNELKEANKDMRDMTIEFNPYDAMGSEYDEDYQVYKHYGAITRIRIEQGATLLIHFPMKYLMEEHQCQLLMSASHEHVLLFGLQAMRKDLFMFHATNEDEFKRSGEIISLIDRKVGNLRMINTFSI